MDTRVPLERMRYARTPTRRPPSIVRPRASVSARPVAVWGSSRRASVRRSHGRLSVSSAAISAAALEGSWPTRGRIPRCDERDQTAGGDERGGRARGAACGSKLAPGAGGANTRRGRGGHGRRNSSLRVAQPAADGRPSGPRSVPVLEPPPTELLPASLTGSVRDIPCGRFSSPSSPVTPSSSGPPSPRGSS